jgi:phospholipase D-like protein
MNAIAISNNDMVYLHWSVPEKIPDCLGFSVIRHDVGTREQTALPAMVGFQSRDEKSAEAGKRFKDTDVWPVQKYSWKDVFAQRGRTYWFEIVPMIGKPGNLQRDASRAMRTNSVSLDPRHGNCAVFFNRGIISTQAIAHSLPKSRSGLPNKDDLKKKIEKPGDPIRARLVGGLEAGVLQLLDRADKDGGECYCGLYELSDRDLVDHLASLGKKKLHLVLSNAGEDTQKGTGDGDGTNFKARAKLHGLGLDVADRMLRKGHIGHNKFVVYVDNRGRPRAVLSGSTNWTPTGLCAQSNNAILIESPDLAAEYLKYWKDLKADTKAANGDGSKLQSAKYRTDNRKARKVQDLIDEHGRPAGTIQSWFSPLIHPH